MSVGVGFFFLNIYIYFFLFAHFLVPPLFPPRDRSESVAAPFMRLRLLPFNNNKNEERCFFFLSPLSVQRRRIGEKNGQRGERWRDRALWG